MTDQNELSLTEQRLLSRRQILQRAGLTLAGGLFTATAEAQGMAPKLILGEGSTRYECIHDWLMPPSSIQWGDTQGIAQSDNGDIYISHTVGGGSKISDAIAVFNARGKFLRSFGAQFKDGGHGIDHRTENGSEYLYHCDTAHRKVVKTDLFGTVVWEKTLNNIIADTNRLYKINSAFVPTNVAFAPNGDFFIADGYGSHYIHQYDLSGGYVRTFGGYGKEPGKLATPHGAWVDNRGKEPLLVVADRSNSRLQSFTMDGVFVSASKDGMRQPCNIDFRGDLTLVPDLSSVVTLLDKKGTVVTQLGDGTKVANLPGRGKARSEFIPGKFVHPHAARFLKNGDILVAEWLPIGRVTLLKKIS
jgi:hypothetical protein